MGTLLNLGVKRITLFGPANKPEDLVLPEGYRVIKDEVCHIL